MAIEDMGEVNPDFDCGCGLFCQAHASKDVFGAEVPRDSE